MDQSLLPSGVSSNFFKILIFLNVTLLSIYIFFSFKKVFMFVLTNIKLVEDKLYFSEACFKALLGMSTDYFNLHTKASLFKSLN